MQKIFMILACGLFFGTVVISKASPLDSPDIVYIDGQPCNSACQSYMAWSRQIMPMPSQSQRIPPRTVSGPKPSKAKARRATRIREARLKPAAKDRRAEQASTSTEMPKAKITNSQAAGKAAATSDAAAAMITGSVSRDGTATPLTARTTFGQVTAAVAVAERITAAMTAPPGLEEKPNIADSSDRSKSALSNNIDPRTAILMARPQIKSVSELDGQEVAVDGKLSVAASNRLRTAIVAAGAAGVQLTESQRKAIDRVIRGEVPAAVLTLASPEAAEMFPEVAGFNILRIPLSPRSIPTDKP